MRFPSIFVRLDNSEVLPWIFENVFPNKIFAPNSKTTNTTTTTLEPTSLLNIPQTCADYESEGYKCVLQDDCEGMLSIRSGGLNYDEDFDLTCSDPSQTCCHQERIKKGNFMLIICTTYKI
jgi:hypothetical protein